MSFMSQGISRLETLVFNFKTRDAKLNLGHVATLSFVIKPQPTTSLSYSSCRPIFEVEVNNSHFVSFPSPPTSPWFPIDTLFPLLRATREWLPKLSSRSILTILLAEEKSREPLSSSPSLFLLNKLSSLIKIFRPTPGVLRLPGLAVATRRSSKNSGRLIPDNCYHGHGLRGARLQIIATSCLHPYTIVTVSRYFLKGFLTVCTYLPLHPVSLVRAQPRLQKRGGIYKATFFVYLKPENLWPVYARALKNIVSSSRVSDGTEGGVKSRGVSEEREKLPTSELVLPLRYTCETRSRCYRDPMDPSKLSFFPS